MFAGLLGIGIGAAVMMIALPADLFGRVPALTGHVIADASQVAVIDGQTLRLHDTVIRLQGITAPPRGQTCHAADGSAFDCGAAASQSLAQLVQGRRVDCQLQGRDPEGIPQAQCTAGDTALNNTLQGRASP